jgi:hypothetical protein
MPRFISIVFCIIIYYASAVEVNRTVDFSWSNPIRDDPFLQLPILPMSIPYFTIEASIITNINDLYYVDIPQVELYLLDPVHILNNI